MSKDIHITLELLNYEREAGRINDKKMFRAIGASFVSMFFIQWVILFVIAVAGSGYLWWLFLQGKKSSRLGPMAEKSKLAKARAEDLQRAAAGFMKVYEKSAQHV